MNVNDIVIGRTYLDEGNPFVAEEIGLALHLADGDKDLIWDNEGHGHLLDEIEQPWVVVVNQRTDPSGKPERGIGQLTAFGPLTERAADEWCATISNGVDDEQRAIYDISWVAAVPYYNINDLDRFDEILTESSPGQED